MAPVELFHQPLLLLPQFRPHYSPRHNSSNEAVCLVQPCRGKVDKERQHPYRRVERWYTPFLVLRLCHRESNQTVKSKTSSPLRCPMFLIQPNKKCRVCNPVFPAFLLRS